MKVHRRVGGRAERGAAAVEFALVVPLLAMLLIGVVTVAVTYNKKIALANGVREAARVGATLPSGSSWGTSVKGQFDAAFAEDAADITFCARLRKVGVVTPVQTVGTGCGTEPAAASSATGCYVTVWATKPASMDWVLGRSSFTLTDQSVAVYDRGQSC